MQTYSEITAKIAAFKRIDLRKAKIGYLKQEIDQICIGHRKSVPILKMGQELYRAVKFEEKPAEKAKLGYPPSGSITDQRANRAGEVRFYCAIGKGLAVLEKAVDGDLIAISKWKIVRKFYINDVRHNRPSVFNQSSVDKVIGKFFATEFGQKINEGKEHLYKLSIAISESLAGANQTIEDLNGVFGWGGLIYPSIHTGGDNLVLFPEVVDSCLELVNVEYVRVDKIESPKVTITHLDFSNTFNDGLIEWNGRVCKWEIESGSEVSVRYGDNGSVLKDSFGNTLEPV